MASVPFLLCAIVSWVHPDPPIKDFSAEDFKESSLGGSNRSRQNNRAGLMSWYCFSFSAFVSSIKEGNTKPSMNFFAGQSCHSRKKPRSQSVVHEKEPAPWRPSSTWWTMLLFVEKPITKSRKSNWVNPRTFELGVSTKDHQGYWGSPDTTITLVKRVLHAMFT